MEDLPPVLDQDQLSPESRRRLSGPGLRTFVHIADLWGLGDEERRGVLGQPAGSDYCEWLDAAGRRRDLVLSADVLTRISAALGIHRALQAIHRTNGDRVSWLRGRDWSATFGGHAPMELVTGGSVEELLSVRRVLDAAASGNHRVEPNEVDRDFVPYTGADIVMSILQSTSASSATASRFDEG